MNVNIEILSDGMADAIGVTRFAEAMSEKLAQKSLEGRGGWNRPDQCSIEDLERMLREHIAKGDPVDIANFAMMIWNRRHPEGV